MFVLEVEACKLVIISRLLSLPAKARQDKKQAASTATLVQKIGCHTTIACISWQGGIVQHNHLASTFLAAQ